MYKVRYIERIGTPGKVLTIKSKEELMQLSAGCKLYKDGWEITEPEDGCTIVVVPEDPVTGAILFLSLVGGVIFSKGAAVITEFIHGRPQDQLNDMDAPDPANSLRGSHNQYRANGRVPIVLGEHMLTPDLAMKPYTSYSNHEQYLHQLFCLGYKNDVKYVAGSEKIGNTKLSSYKNYWKANGTSHANRLVHELNVGVEITRDGEETWEERKVVRHSPSNTTKVTVGISMPHGLYRYDTDDDYERKSHSVTFEVYVQGVDGISYEQKYVKRTLSDDRDYVRWTEIFADLPKGKHRVSVVRYSHEKGDANHVETMYWDVLQSDLEIEDGTTAPVHSDMQSKLNLLSLKIQASNQLNGMVDEFNVEAYTYIPDYKGYGSGSGAWTKKKTSNPASLLLYVLRSANINRKPVPNNKIEWAEFEEYWRWCDTKGYSFNAVLTGDYTIADIIEMITNASRATLTMYNGKYGVTIDRAVNSIDFHLTPKNTMGGTLQTKPFVGGIKNLKCRFADKDSGYAENELIIAVNEKGEFVSDEQEGETQEVTFVGITDKDQMWDIGKHELAKATRRVVTYSVQQDWEYLTAYPGAVGYLANDMLLYGIKSGRITDIDHNAEGKIAKLELDENVTFEAGKNYSLVVRHNSEAEGIQTYNIISGETETDYVLLSAPTDANIEAGNLYTFAERGTEPLKVLCTGVTPSNDHAATLELVEYQEEIYTNSDELGDWVSSITIPPESDNPGWEKEVPPYIPPAKPGDPAKDLRLTASEATVHSSSRGILKGENITLECKLFNLVYVPEGTTNEDGETLPHTAIDWSHNEGFILTDTADPLIKTLDLTVHKNLEYIRKSTAFAIGVTFTDKDGTQYTDSVSIPVVYDGLTCEYLGDYATLPEATVDGEPLLVGDWFLAKDNFTDNQGHNYIIADIYEYFPADTTQPWKLCTNASKIAQALPDLAKIDMERVDNANNPGRQFFQRIAVNQAFINSLVAQTITIPEGGHIQSANFGNGGQGFRLSGQGQLSITDGDFSGTFKGGKGDSHKLAVFSAVESGGLGAILYKEPTMPNPVPYLSDPLGALLTVRNEIPTEPITLDAEYFLRVTEPKDILGGKVPTLECSDDGGAKWFGLDCEAYEQPRLSRSSVQYDVVHTLGALSITVSVSWALGVQGYWSPPKGSIWTLQLKSAVKGLSVSAPDGNEYLSAEDGVVTANQLVIDGGTEYDSSNYKDVVNMDSSPPLRIGKPDKANMVIDRNEIVALDNGESATLWIQHLGTAGETSFGGEVTVHGPLEVYHNGDNGGAGDPNLTSTPIMIKGANLSTLLLDHNEIACIGTDGKPTTLGINCWGHNATVEVGALLTGGNITSNHGTVSTKYLNVSVPQIPAIISTGYLWGKSLYEHLYRGKTETRPVSKGTFSRKYKYDGSYRYNHVDFDYYKIKPRGSSWSTIVLEFYKLGGGRVAYLNTQQCGLSSPHGDQYSVSATFARC